MAGTGIEESDTTIPRILQLLPKICQELRRTNATDYEAYPSRHQVQMDRGSTTGIRGYKASISNGNYIGLSES